MTTNRTKPKRTRRNHDPSDILDSLDITKVRTRTQCGGLWVFGTLAGHRFEALLFPAHAESPEFELEQSRISKLRVRRLRDQTTVANFDRGWDRRPTTRVANQIVDTLAAGLADLFYAE